VDFGGFYQQQHWLCLIDAVLLNIIQELSQIYFNSQNVTECLAIMPSISYSDGPKKPSKSQSFCQKFRVLKMTNRPLQ
jgi:hypothetical protein